MRAPLLSDSSLPCGDRPHGRVGVGGTRSDVERRNAIKRPHRILRKRCGAPRRYILRGMGEWGLNRRVPKGEPAAKGPYGVNLSFLTGSFPSYG